MRVTLRDARLAAGLTQKELAEKTGLSRSAYVNIERGRKNPSLEAALCLAKVLGRQVEELFSSSHSPVEGPKGKGKH